MNLTDKEIVKALECCHSNDNKTCRGCYFRRDRYCRETMAKHSLDLINRLQDEKKALINGQETLQKTIVEQRAEIEEWKLEQCRVLHRCSEQIIEARDEAIKEFAERVNEIFMRYAHLHSHTEDARKDYIEAVDGTEIEMQSVWDVFTLKKHEMAEYEEMNRLQENIETIAKDRLLTELEKEFRLLVKEMTEQKE